MDFSIVIPVNNEMENIAPLVEEIRRALEDFDYEVIYVDDGSTDETLLRLRRVQAEWSRLRIIRHQQSCGQSTAIHTGVRQARAPWIVTLDGDGQNDPADIPRLFSLVHDAGSGERPACVCGFRRERQDDFLRRLSSRVANRVRSRLLGDATPDTGCGLKVFSREAFLRLPCFDHMHRFLPALFLRDGGVVRSVEVNHRPRCRGISKYGLWDRLWVGIDDLWGMMWLRRRGKIPTIIQE